MQITKPSSPGWKTIKITERYSMERYFDGALWSAPCYSDDPADIRARARARRAESQRVEWTEVAA